MLSGRCFQAIGIEKKRPLYSVRLPISDQPCIVDIALLSEERANEFGPVTVHRVTLDPWNGLAIV